MTNLDTIDFAKYDKSGMIAQIKSFTQDFRKAWELTKSISLPSEYKKIQNVVLLGMGGSGAANEAIRELAYSNACPIECVHDYDLPGYVNENTLVIASSYSGNTEETIRGFSEAKKRNAKLIAITTGGEIKRLAEEYDVPRFIFDYPSEPRMATPYLLSPLLRIFAQLDLYELPENFDKVCDEAEPIIRQFYPEELINKNIAKQLALNLYKKFPIIYSSPYTKGLAMRFKNQINENAKKTAAYDYFPELNHNTIEGYVNADCDLVIVGFQSKFGLDRIQLREKITAEILNRNNVQFERISFNEPTNPLVEHLVLMSFSDAVSFYLSILNQTDPTSIPNIKYLKSQL